MRGWSGVRRLRIAANTRCSEATRQARPRGAAEGLAYSAVMFLSVAIFFHAARSSRTRAATAATAVDSAANARATAAPVSAWVGV